MKILMLTPYLPYPPSSGGQVRSYNLLKNLGKKNKVVLVALIKNDEEKKFVKNLEEYCEKIYVCKRSESPWTINNILKSVFGRYPFLVVRNFSGEAQEVITDLLKREKFDLIHAETFYIMPHIPETDVPILLVEQTIEYRVYQHFVKNLKYFFLRPLFYFDILKLQFWEKTYWKKADLVGAVSQADKDRMLQLLPELKIKIIPNAAGDDLLMLYSSDKKEIEPVFLYLGNFSWLQNVEAAEILAKTIWPKIKENVANARCIIAGQRAEKKIGHLKNRGVEIIDILPDDIESVKNVYKKSSIFVAPIQGPGGTRLKILGAMAAGLPVVVSRAGIQGLEVTNNHDVLIAQSDSDFAQKTVEVLKNKKLYFKIRENARKLVEEKYSWKSISQRLEDVYLDLKK